MKEAQKARSRAVVTLTLEADFLDGDESTNGVKHSIRFTIDDPGTPPGRDRQWGPGMAYGFQLGRIARALQDYLCGCKGPNGVADGFLRGIQD